MALPKIDDWGIEFFRISAFTTAALDKSCLEWWEKLAGSGPETVTSKPSIGMHSAEGAAGSGRLQLTAIPGRVDWLYIAAPSEETPVPDLGSLSSREDIVKGYLKIWSDLAPSPIERIAFGMTARLKVEDRISGYRQMAELLPTVTIDPENSSDFAYQINRARPSRVIENLKLNRLAKWGVVRIDFAALAALATMVKVPVAEYCRVELDLNTDAASKADLSKKLLALYQELLDHGKGILQAGDST